MKDRSVADRTISNSNQTAGEDVSTPEKKAFNRRSFLRNSVVAGAAVTAGAALLESVPSALAQSSASLTRGDIDILRWLAAAEIIESDLWLQYQELAGIQDNEVSTIASKQIHGYPATASGGNAPYTSAVSKLDGDMAQYIHDNTEDELSHEEFINAYLASKGANPVSLERFRTLDSSSRATGANRFPRLTDLRKLTVDTTWWTRYRSRTGNPDLGDTFKPAVPSLVVGTHPGIPRTDDDLNDANFLQAIANTDGFHFADIEVGGASMYPSLAQRVTSVEVLRILLSIGGTEIMHFQTWHDKAGNAVPSPNGQPVIDPVTKIPVFFPDLTAAAVPAVGEDLQSNLIMPEPTAFLHRGFPACSIVRPTATQRAATVALQGFVNMNVFVGQSKAFFAFVTQLAQAADAAQRGV